MSKQLFSPMEIDAIGEIMNISLGSSATAVSNMLDHRVDITTPKVTVVDAKDFSLGKLEPAIGVEIKYVSGLEGSNIMLLKMSDVRVITDILLYQDTPEEEFELNDLTISAVCEVMNQMMGAASTALSDFLGRMVNISTPQTFDANDLELMKKERLPVPEGPIVVVQFALSIEESVKSEFMNVISVDLAKELVAGFGLETEDDGGEEEAAAPAPAPEPEPAPASGGGKLSQEEIERLMNGGAPAPEPAPAPGGGKLSQEEIERLMNGGAPAPAPEPAPAPSGGKLSQEEIERLMNGGASAPAPEPAPAPSGGKLSQEEIEKLMGGGAPAPQPQPQPVPPQPQYPVGGGAPPAYYNSAPVGWAMPPEMLQMQQMMMQQMQQMAQMQQQMAQMRAAPAPEPAGKKPDSRVIQTKAAPMPRLEDGTALGEEESKNLDLIMSVPLEVAVEIGRTRKKVKEILALSKGSLVVLDKLAGDQVDVYVNGKCIAHGDVVVIDDNFGIRISEIVRKPGLEDLKP